MTLFVFFLVAIIGSIVALVMLKSGETARFETSATPQEVLNTAMATAGAGRRWSTLNASESVCTFSYYRKPRLLIGIPLLFFFLIPGIIYFIIAGKTESLSVSTMPIGNGFQVQAVSNGFRGKQIGRTIRRKIETAGAVTSGITNKLEQ